MTEEEFEKEINRLLVQIEFKAKRAERIEKLLKQALPFVRTHWETSHAGTGLGAQRLMNEIKAIFGMK